MVSCRSARAAVALVAFAVVPAAPAARCFSLQFCRFSLQMAAHWPAIGRG
jgi:hypothetical protein